MNGCKKMVNNGNACCSYRIGVEKERPRRRSEECDLRGCWTSKASRKHIERSFLFSLSRIVLNVARLGCVMELTERQEHPVCGTGNGVGIPLRQRGRLLCWLIENAPLSSN